MGPRSGVQPATNPLTEVIWGVGRLGLLLFGGFCQLHQCCVEKGVEDGTVTSTSMKQLSFSFGGVGGGELDLELSLERTLGCDLTAG